MNMSYSIGIILATIGCLIGVYIAGFHHGRTYTEALRKENYSYQFAREKKIALDAAFTKLRTDFERNKLDEVKTVESENHNFCDCNYDASLINRVFYPNQYNPNTTSANSGR